MTAVAWSGDRHLRIAVAEASTPDAWGLVRAAARRLRGAGLPGLVDLVPAYTTVLAEFEGEGLEPGRIGRAVEELLRGLEAEVVGAGRLVEVPVCYGGECAPDLGEVSSLTGLSREEVVGAHSRAEYVACFIGFQPGFAYLGGLPDVLRVARLDRPRARVAAGSVGIAGDQAGVYPFESPGGWRLIGRTPVRVFDVGRDRPALIEAGDRVRFVPISEARFGEMARAAALGLAGRPAASAGLRIIESGMVTTVQDMGRPGLGSLGVARGGAADRLSLGVGNALVGNDASAAGLEMTMVGAVLECEREVVVAITGGDVDAAVERSGKREAVPMWRVVRMARGERLRVGRVKRGARVYVCIGGGVDVPVVLGGRGTHLGAGIGGHEGRALRAGDRIAIGGARGEMRRMDDAEIAAVRGRIFRPEIRIVAGAQYGEFAEPMRLCQGEYRVGSQSDRVGVRLEGGERIVPPRGGRMVSEGMMWGAVQVPEDGRPIVLGADRPTTGGYPVVGCVVEEDLSAVGQLAPGATVRFRMVRREDL